MPMMFAHGLVLCLLCLCHGALLRAGDDTPQDAVAEAADNVAAAAAKAQHDADQASSALALAQTNQNSAQADLATAQQNEDAANKKAAQAVADATEAAAELASAESLQANAEQAAAAADSTAMKKKDAYKRAQEALSQFQTLAGNPAQALADAEDKRKKLQDKGDDKLKEAQDAEGEVDEAEKTEEIVKGAYLATQAAAAQARAEEALKTKVHLIVQRNRALAVKKAALATAASAAANATVNMAKPAYDLALEKQEKLQSAATDHSKETKQAAEAFEASNKAADDLAAAAAFAVAKATSLGGDVPEDPSDIDLSKAQAVVEVAHEEVTLAMADEQEEAAAHEVARAAAEEARQEEHEAEEAEAQAKADAEEMKDKLKAIE